MIFAVYGADPGANESIFEDSLHERCKTLYNNNDM